SVIAKQRQPGADVRGNTLNQPRQAAFVGAVHLAKKLVTNRAEIAFKSVAAGKHCSSPSCREDAAQFSNERLTTLGGSRPGSLRVGRESVGAMEPAACRHSGAIRRTEPGVSR